MFSIDSYSQIISHLKLNSKVFKEIPGGEWYQMFCPYCDDSVRKNGHLDHGHLYVARNWPYFLCFRCNESGGLRKLLIHIEFDNDHILNEISSVDRGDVRYTKSDSSKNEFNDVDITIPPISENQYLEFIKYIESRCGSINLAKYRIYPIIDNNMLAVCFMNSNGFNVVLRYISNKNTRYRKLNKGQYYFFQPMFDIICSRNIVIAEGTFDIINLKESSLFSEDTFYIAICGSNYYGLVRYLVTNYLMVGCYNIHIFFDSNVDKKNIIMLGINKLLIRLNNDIMIKYYNPTLTKDISELMLFSEI